MAVERLSTHWLRSRSVEAWKLRGEREEEEKEGEGGGGEKRKGGEGGKGRRGEGRRGRKKRRERGGGKWGRVRGREIQWGGGVVLVYNHPTS